MTRTALNLIVRNDLDVSVEYDRETVRGSRYWVSLDCAPLAVVTVDEYADVLLSPVFDADMFEDEMLRRAGIFATVLATLDESYRNVRVSLA
jgi:hypothetical protein